MNRDAPLVSVIIPTRDRPSLLREAIESVLSQTWRNLEAIVVNDGGEDVSHVLSSFRDKRILYLRHEKSTGVSGARNTGLKIAQGKYIAYLDDDDIYYPRHIETIISALEETGYMIGYTDAYQAFQRWDSGRFVTIRKQITFSQEFDRERLLIKCCMPVLSVMHRRECLEPVGLFDEGLSVHEDWDMWIRLSRHFDFLHINRVTAEFRTRQGFDSITSGDLTRFLDTMKTIHKRYSHLISDPMTRKAQKAIVSVSERRLSQRYLSISPLDTSSIKEIEDKISVIIPVRDGGNGLIELIKAIHSQRRVSDVEIILVHRGIRGIDNMARGYDLRLVDMKEGEYNHGRACKAGIDEAQGRYLVFTSEEAMPVNMYWLYSIVKPFITNPGLEVLSTRRFLKNDRDRILSCLYDLSHNIWFRDTITTYLNGLKSYDWRFFDKEVKERFGYVDFVSACIKKDSISGLVLSPLRDHEYLSIDLGRILLERGMSSGYLAGTGVYCSYEHDVDCLLRREYFRARDLYLFRNGLPSFFEINRIRWEDMLSDIFNAYRVVSDSLIGVDDTESTLAPMIGRFLKNLEREIKRDDERVFSLDCSPDDREAKQLWRLLFSLNGRAPERTRDMNLVIPDFIDRFRTLTDRILTNADLKEKRGHGLVPSIYKILGMVIGELLGAYICEAMYLNRMTPELKEADSLLLSDTVPSQTPISETPLEGICL